MICMQLLFSTAPLTINRLLSTLPRSLHTIESDTNDRFKDVNSFVLCFLDSHSHCSIGSVSKISSNPGI